MYGEAKLTELIVYTADRLRGDRSGGATKLNKVLFFADFSHVRKYGRPITGAEYQKLAYGPAPRRLMPIRRALVAAGEATLEAEDFLGRSQHRLIPNRSADLRLFDGDELATIDAVLDDLAGLSGTQVSNLSHEEPAWRHTPPEATIPYELAFVPKEQVVTPTARRLAKEVAVRYGLVAAE